MTVREFMAMWVDDISIKVYQRPIKKIDKCDDLVHRQTGSVDVLINSNQNYLDFEIEYLMQDDDLIIIVCKANKEQEQRTIDAYKS